MEDIILEGKQIVKNFALKKEVFREKQKILQAVGGINIQLRRGQTIGIVGESGSGNLRWAKFWADCKGRPAAGFFIGGKIWRR